MRRPLVAGNWKMNGSKTSVAALLKGIVNESGEAGQFELAVLPPYVFLEQTQQTLAKTTIIWGAQDVSDKTTGAYTGEISAAMLLDFGCCYVLVGHSERRTLYGEDNAIVAAKFFAASKAGLQPILCVGENIAQRKDNQTEHVIQQQLDAVLKVEKDVSALAKAVIAYEPVWAIGTGLAATPEQAEAVHKFIRQYVGQFDADIAQQLRILYGGSVKSDNAKALFAMPDIDGGLIGGASLNAHEFLEIARSCNNSY